MDDLRKCPVCEGLLDEGRKVRLPSFDVQHTLGEFREFKCADCGTRVIVPERAMMLMEQKL